jgi:hypothetical protein
MLLKRRGRPKKARLQELIEREEFQRRNDEIVAARERRLDPELCCLIGEVTPGIDAENVADALLSALRFAQVYKFDSPVIVGVTTLLDLERRMFYEAVRTRQPWLCQDGTLCETISEYAPDRPFDSAWIPLPGSDVAISQEQLDTALLEIKARGDKQW